MTGTPKVFGHYASALNNLIARAVMFAVNTIPIGCPKGVEHPVGAWAEEVIHHVGASGFVRSFMQTHTEGIKSGELAQRVSLTLMVCSEVPGGKTLGHIVALSVLRDAQRTHHFLSVPLPEEEKKPQFCTDVCVGFKDALSHVGPDSGGFTACPLDVDTPSLSILDDDTRNEIRSVTDSGGSTGWYIVKASDAVYGYILVVYNSVGDEAFAVAMASTEY